MKTIAVLIPAVVLFLLVFAVLFTVYTVSTGQSKLDLSNSADLLVFIFIEGILLVAMVVFFVVLKDVMEGK